VTESWPWDESVSGVEAMVLAAGQYVGASDDLRPRVLEAVRLQCGEQSVQRRLRHVALVVVLLALLTPELRQGFNEPQMRLSGGIEEIGFDVLNSLSPAATTRSGDGDWRMIDAFTKLRRQQAQLLRFEI
jgi:hypothetical protein